MKCEGREGVVVDGKVESGGTIRHLRPDDNPPFWSLESNSCVQVSKSTWVRLRVCLHELVTIVCDGVLLSLQFTGAYTQR
jgi:hypothetical protein